MKLTAALTQFEFRRAIEIRRTQIKNDRASLKEWETAEKMAAAYWREHPDWTFGQCAKAIASDLKDKAA